MMQNVSNAKLVCCKSPSTSSLSLYEIMQHGLNLWHLFERTKSNLIFKCKHPSSDLNILPVDHAGTRLDGRLKQMAVHMKKLLQTLLLSRSAGFEASWEAAGGA